MVSTQSFLLPPSWIQDNTAFQRLLQHSKFLSSDFDSLVDVDDFNVFSQGLRQYFFWKRELTPSISRCTVMFALLGQQGLQFPNVIEIFKAIGSVCDLSNAIEFCPGANSKFIGVSFNNEADVSKVMDNFKYFKDTVVAYVAYSSTRSYQYRLLWLPPLFPMTSVQHLLEKYCSHYDTVKESQRISDSAFIPSAVIKGTLVPKHSQSIESLPHLIRLPEPHRGSALLVISGRQSICLKCHSVGHVRKVCTMVKCNVCRRFHVLGGSCDLSSYSDKLRGKFVSEEKDDWPEDVDVAPIENFLSGCDNVSQPVETYVNNEHDVTSVGGGILKGPQMPLLNVKRGGINAFKVGKDREFRFDHSKDFPLLKSDEGDHARFAPMHQHVAFPSSLLPGQSSEDCNFTDGDVKNAVELGLVEQVVDCPAEDVHVTLVAEPLLDEHADLEMVKGIQDVSGTSLSLVIDTLVDENLGGDSGAMDVGCHERQYGKRKVPCDSSPEQIEPGMDLSIDDPVRTRSMSRLSSSDLYRSNVSAKVSRSREKT